MRNGGVFRPSPDVTPACPVGMADRSGRSSFVPRVSTRYFLREGVNMTEKSQEAGHKRQAVAEEAKVIQLIVFDLGKEEYGADISQVREIIRIRTVTPMPDSPDFIKGVTNVRGEIAVVIDLKTRFFLRTKKEVESKHIIITEQEKDLFGLLVDEVTEVLRIPETDIKPAPELITRIEEKYIKGVVTLENRLIIMLDLTKVLSAEELARLAEASREYRAEGRKRRTRPALPRRFASQSEAAGAGGDEGRETRDEEGQKKEGAPSSAKTKEDKPKKEEKTATAERAKEVTGKGAKETT